MPANTFIATVEAIVAVGATPVFVDVADDTLLVDRRRTSKPRSRRAPQARSSVHLYGQMPDMDAIARVDAARRDRARRRRRAGARRALARRPAGSSGDAAALQLLPGQEPRRVRRRGRDHHERRRARQADPLHRRPRSSPRHRGTSTPYRDATAGSTRCRQRSCRSSSSASTTGTAAARAAADAISKAAGGYGLPGAANRPALDAGVTTSRSCGSPTGRKCRRARQPRHRLGPPLPDTRATGRTRSGSSRQRPYPVDRGGRRRDRLRPDVPDDHAGMKSNACAKYWSPQPKGARSGTGS